MAFIKGLPKDLVASIKGLSYYYRKVLVPKGHEYALAWRIPFPHELMEGEGRLFRMWADVFHKVPFELAKE